MKIIVEMVYNHLRKIQTYKRTFSELSRLTDRELSDIGINRCDIHRVANGEKTSN